MLVKNVPDAIRIAPAQVTCRPRGASRVDELFPSQDHLQRKNNQSAHWQLAIRLNGVSTTSAAPAKKSTATSDLITFQG